MDNLEEEKMKGLKNWTIAVLSLCAVNMNVHAGSHNDEGTSHGSQKKARIICGAHSLQAAVDRAREGATITVQGTCTEEVVIRKDRIRITGAPGATMQPPTGGIAFSVLGNGVEISDFSIVGGAVGIDIAAAASAEVTGNRIFDYTNSGILIRGNANGDIRNNYLASLADDFAAINLLSSASAQLERNEIANASRNGINIAATSSALLACNDVSVSHGFFAGVFVSRTAQVAFATGCPNTISNSHPVGPAIACSQTSSIFAGENQDLIGAIQLHPNCEVVRLPFVTIP